ncbi:MAG: YggS family pyridoxal phosphate-dependent enzyme [Spirochaetes bacterium]|nr:YggS family pyridoxal phosphate-dependent enzyme [Spirochaetota bacterium]
MSIKENLKIIQDEVRETALKKNQDPKDITLVAVSKTFPVQSIREVFEAGVVNIGESRVQEAEEKIRDLKDLPLVWHLVGHLQSNKAKKAVGEFAILQSMDKIPTLEKVDEIAARKGIVQEVLVEVNTTAEPNKFGISPQDLWSFLDQAISLKQIRIKGLMTIGPFTDEKKKIKDCFLLLKDLFQEARSKYPEIPWRYLSMGMSDDYLVAVECGSNMLRIGRKIFGERNY